MKNLIAILFFLIAISIYAQQDTVTIKLYNSDNTPKTGQSTYITFRYSPYLVDITGLTVIESGSIGNYLIWGFPSYAKARLFLSGTLVTTWGSQWVGDPRTYFGAFSVTNHWLGTNYFEGSQNWFKLYSPLLDPVNCADYLAGNPAYGNTLVWKQWITDNYLTISDSNSIYLTLYYGTTHLPFIRNDIDQEIDHHLTYLNKPSLLTYWGEAPVCARYTPADSDKAVNKLYVDSAITAHGVGYLPYIRNDIDQEIDHHLTYLNKPSLLTYWGEAPVCARYTAADSDKATNKLYVDSTITAKVNQVLVSTTYIWRGDTLTPTLGAHTAPYDTVGVPILNGSQMVHIVYTYFKTTEQFLTAEGSVGFGNSTKIRLFWNKTASTMDIQSWNSTTLTWSLIQSLNFYSWVNSPWRVTILMESPR